jgi:hypothetical protein
VAGVEHTVITAASANSAAGNFFITARVLRIDEGRAPMVTGRGALVRGRPPMTPGSA